MLEPAARSYVNIPQDNDADKRINCANNDNGAYKAHMIVMQSSRNYF